LRQLVLNPYNVLTLIILVWAAKIPPTQQIVPSFQGFTKEETEEISTILQDTNQYKNKSFLFKKVELGEYILGQATEQYFDCFIELSPIIFIEKEYFKPVVHHEIGHCFGLDHTPNEKDIMYESAHNIKDYTQADWDRYFQQLKSCF